MKAEYAPLPSAATFETITLLQAETALESAKQAKEGILLGLWEGNQILKKKGPYGFYASCTRNSVALKVPIKAGDSLEAIQAKFQAKILDDTHKIGDFTIKTGPFGPYCFNHTLKKAVFVKWPSETDPKTVTVEEITKIYTEGAAKKRAGGGRGGWRGRGGKK